MNVIFSLLILLINALHISTVAAAAKITKTITVHNEGNGDFKTIQAAIDSIPAGNNNWIKIKIKAGTYKEKVKILEEKGYLMLEGDGADKTIISWSDHDPKLSLYDDHTNDSATMAIWAENVVLKGLSIRNDYGGGIHEGKAVAATLAGDKIAVYGCKFIGIQDTLNDLYHRHYFHHCHIEGAIDYIWGFGQSLYENCTLQTVRSGLKNAVWVTAHGRHEEDSSGFVFKNCILGGNVKTYLGRAWGPFARVIFYQTAMGAAIVPGGWDNNKFDVKSITFVESNNYGRGADLQGRVKWMKHMSTSELDSFVDRSFVDDGWIDQQPMR